MLTITSHVSTPGSILISDVGIIIPGGGGSDSFDSDALRLFERSNDLVDLGTDDAFGVGAHTLTLSDANGSVPAAEIARYIKALDGSVSPNTTFSRVVSCVLVSSGPAAGYAPLTRTHADGTVHAYTYLADGFSVNTLTETRPGLDPVVYTAVYSNGVRTHWTTP